jgi:hypothetical protein
VHLDHAGLGIQVEIAVLDDDARDVRRDAGTGGGKAADGQRDGGDE